MVATHVFSIFCGWETLGVVVLLWLIHHSLSFHCFYRIITSIVNLFGITAFVHKTKAAFRMHILG